MTRLVVTTSTNKYHYFYIMADESTLELWGKIKLAEQAIAEVALVLILAQAWKMRFLVQYIDP